MLVINTAEEKAIIIRQSKILHLSVVIIENV